MLCYLVFLSLIFAFNVIAAQTICRYNRNMNGVCKPFKDCTELHNAVIFPHMKCEADGICCPQDMGPTLFHLPIPADKGAQHTQESQANADIKPIDEEEFNKRLQAVFDYPGKIPNETGIKPNATSQAIPSLTLPTRPINLDEDRLKGIFTLETNPNLISQVATTLTPAHRLPAQMPPADTATMPTDEQLNKKLNEIFEWRESVLNNKQKEFEETSSQEESSEEGNASPQQNITVAFAATQNTALDNFESSLNPRGVNILRAQKCGYVHASKNPNDSNIAAEILEFPWLALLRYKTNDIDERVFGCGGSLITDRWVLTAAQCINSSLYRVRLGEYDLKKNSRIDCTREGLNKTCAIYKNFRIKATLIHPDYNAETKTKDIALIKLKTRARIYKNIKPICLPTASALLDTPFNERKLIMAGWRSTTEGGSSTILRKHFIDQQRFLICMVAYPSRNYDTDDSKICLAGSDQVQSTCSGDAGGPAFWLAQQNAEEFYVQLAIVPLDMQKCGGATNVAPYYAERVVDSMDWITRVIGEDV